MTVLDRAALEQSPLADLHAIASELSLDSYRRLRKGALIDAIVAKQSGVADTTEPEPDEDHGPEEDRAGKRRRGRRGGGGRGKAAVREEAEEEPRAAEPEREEEPEPEPVPEAEIVEGDVELLPNGSGFVRVQPPDPSDADVYISAAQVKRCELVTGDRITGPRRPPRRSERFASLVRIDTINGRPAVEVAEGARFDDLEAAFPSERLALGTEDPTVKAIEWLTPFGKGSRVTVVGAGRSGKTEALRRLADALAPQEGLQVTVVLAGVRPEEIPEWSKGAANRGGAVSFAASADVQGDTVELAIDQGRRVATRGADAVVLIDTLDGLHPHVARKAIAAARNIVGGGSLTVIATSSAPIGGETTVIALDPALATTGRFPALDLAASGTIRPELLVGDAGAEAIARAREEALDR